MPIDSVPSKYATIVNTLQARIDTGAYPVDGMLPSEAQLVREFAVSRSTVVRALEYLRQQGYIEGVQGKGRLVRSRPTPQASRLPDRVRRFLRTAESAPTILVGVGRTPAPRRIAANLALPVGAAVVVRQRLIPATDVDPLTLSTVYAPATAANGAAFDAADLLGEGLLQHLEKRGQLVAHDVIERLAARRASAHEVELLKVHPGACLMTALLIARDHTGRPLLAVDVLTPASGQAIEEIYNLR
ncbi:MAG TPA: GntR family transcriptional regulator [Actinoplanes sp.]